MFIDRRGSVFIPMEVKRHLNLKATDALLVRVLGPTLLILPASYCLSWPADDAGRDARLRALLEDCWKGMVPGAGQVAPPGYVPVPKVPKEQIPEAEDTAALNLERQVYVNKKGFIQIPDEFKQLLGMRNGDPYLLEIRQRSGKPVLMISPVDHTVSMANYLERRRQQHMRDARQQEQRAALAAEVAQLEVMVRLLNDQKRDLKEQLDQLKEGLP